MSYCLFHSGRLSRAIRQDAVKEVLVHRALTPLPLAPAALEGMAAVRGEVLPVFCLAGIEDGEAPAAGSESGRILVLEDAGRRFGILVDKIEQVSNLEGHPGLVPFEEGELSRRLERIFFRAEAA
jgi:purine-binding chemotaxis protein CheW